MIYKSVRIAVVATCLILFGSHAFGAISKDPLTVELPALEMMPGMSWFLLGERMAINGVPIKIQQFVFKGKVEDVALFYRGVFKTKGHGKLSEKHLGADTLIGYELGELYYSVQMHQEAQKVVGRTAVTPSPLNYKVSMKTTLPLPPRSNVLSKVESLDAGRKAETLTVDSKMDVRYIVNYYFEQFQQDGWQVFSKGGDLESSAVVSFQRGGELIQLTVKGLQHSNSQKTQFLINWLK